VKLKQINVQDTIKNVQDLLKEEQNISSALKAAIELLLWFVSVLANWFKLTSENSSKPPSTDVNRKRGSKKQKSDKKAGGQEGHAGCRLERVSHPDEIKAIEIDKRTLPLGNYLEDGYESRQVIDIRISKWVTEYRAQILKDEQGNGYVAPFPSDVKSAVQYGNQLKSHAVYLSQYQLLPYQRIQDYFREQMKTPLSAGTLFNFNQEAYDLLETFDGMVKLKLKKRYA
jgi:transposase